MSAARPVRRYDTDPPRVNGGVVLPRPMTDPRRLTPDMPVQRVPIKAIPDELLISTLVAHGQPRWSAEELRHNPMLRFYALRFWCDVQAAAEGDAEAQEHVDSCRALWVEMRREEVVADLPHMSVGFWER